MGKKQHSKDRLYLTTKEWAEEWGGHKRTGHLPYTRLPFYCCAISFTQFEDPVCTSDGCVFDIVNIVPYVQRYHKNPVTGNPLELKDLIQLKFYKNHDNDYHCPIMNKVFTEHTHIVAIKNTGNVYCWEAVELLNIKPRNLRDLLLDVPFVVADIIHIQDPLNFKNRVVKDFQHVVQELRVKDISDDSCFRNLSNDAMQILKGIGSEDSKVKSSSEMKETRTKARVLLENERKKALEIVKSEAKITFKPGASTWDTENYITLAEQNKKRASKRRKNESEVSSKIPQFDPDGKKPCPKIVYEPYVKYVTAQETTGEMSRGFTSTVMRPETTNKRKLIRVETRPSKKGYVSILTTCGNINLELHCDMVPRTCENFLGLAEMQYYNDTIFHRSIKNFMIQGGDPTGTGLCGSSIYGLTFKDEFDMRLKHDARGVVSMANSGPNTNGSQFFICFKSASHLDGKHSVFGRVVGGFETLSKMEKIDTDDKDRPLEDIRIESVKIYMNPFQDINNEEEKQKQRAEVEEKEREEGEKRGLWYSDPAASSEKIKSTCGRSEEAKSNHLGIGKYINAGDIKNEASIKLLDDTFDK